jgi:hypothetical protein
MIVIYPQMTQMGADQFKRSHYEGAMQSSTIADLDLHRRKMKDIRHREKRSDEAIHLLRLPLGSGGFFHANVGRLVCNARTAL